MSIKYLVLLLLLSTPSFADECKVQCPVTQDNVWNRYEQDKFRWTDPDQQVHMLIGFSGALVIGDTLTRYANLKPWQSALIGTLTMTLVGVTKEVMFDSWTSRSDIKGWSIGAAAGGVSTVILHF